MIRVTFACGHVVTVSESAETPPQCDCGERRVSRVKAPPPRFRGACETPLKAS